MPPQAHLHRATIHSNDLVDGLYPLYPVAVAVMAAVRAERAAKVIRVAVPDMQKPRTLCLDDLESLLYAPAPAAQ